MAGQTLAPSLFAAEDLRRNGVLRVARWARGVELQRFIRSIAIPRYADGWHLAESCLSATSAGLRTSGVPVVGPSAGGLRDLVAPGRTGSWFAPGSAASLYAQAAALAADTPGRLAMGAAARSSVAGRGWDVIGQELIQHYREVSSV